MRGPDWKWGNQVFRFACKPTFLRYLPLGHILIFSVQTHTAEKPFADFFQLLFRCLLVIHMGTYYACWLMMIDFEIRPRACQFSFFQY